MPRRNTPRRQRPRASDSSERPLHGLGATRSESWGAEEWLVRPVPGSRAVKRYRCPGCDHEIMPGTGHVVAWPADELGRIEDRRHWHSGCWAARERRGPTRRY